MTHPDPPDPSSVSSLVGDVASTVTRLVRQEVELARAEIRAEATKAIRGTRALAIGSVGLLLFAVLISLGGALALAQVLADRRPELANWSTPIATGAVAVGWFLIGLLFLLSGRRRLRSLSPVPRQTIQSIKEDIAWLRRPNASGRTSPTPGPTSPATSTD
jgi:hypothetical protein